MEIDQVKVAIGSIVVLEIGMGITAIAGIVGYDMKKK